MIHVLQVDWAKYITKTIFAPNSGKAVTKEERVACENSKGTKCSQYLEELRDLVNSSGKRVVANYLGWR